MTGKASTTGVVNMTESADTSAGLANALPEVAVLGGGCFWCTESVFAALKGVLSVVPGYAGGHVQNPSYEQVCNKDTGHVEVVKVTFDPTQISFESLLHVFFATHDPTTLNRQGADVGPQYASTIFYQSDAQQQVARHVMQQVEQALEQPVVTQLRANETFWEAESYHHDYYARNPNQGYCAYVIAPKMQKLRKLFAPYLKTVL